MKLVTSWQTKNRGKVRVVTRAHEWYDKLHNFDTSDSAVWQRFR